MDNILRQPEPDQEGTGNPTAFDVEFSNVEFAYTKGIPVWIMSLSVSPKER